MLGRSISFQLHFSVGKHTVAAGQFDPLVVICYSTGRLTEHIFNTARSPLFCHPAMTSLLPVAVYGLEVPSGDVIIPAVPDFPATVSTFVRCSSVRLQSCSFALPWLPSTQVLVQNLMPPVMVSLSLELP